MINYNLILYIGIAFILAIFIGFIISEIRKRNIEIELFNQKRLDESFKNADKTNNGRGLKI
mgnify:FL=1